MARRKGTADRGKGRLGSILTTLGLAALLADLAFLVVPLTRLAEKASGGLMGIVPTIGMSFLRAARAVAFHQVDYFSLTARILVLFSAMVAVIVGLVLWRTRTARDMASGQTTLSSIGEREIQ